MKLIIEIDDKEVALFLTKLRDIWNPPSKPREISPERKAAQLMNSAKGREVLQKRREEAKLKAELENKEETNESTIEQEIKQEFKKKRQYSPETKQVLADQCAKMREIRLGKINAIKASTETLSKESENKPIIHQPDKTKRVLCYKCQIELIREYVENPITHRNYHKQCYA
jgi:hypothetical protein